MEGMRLESKFLLFLPRLPVAHLQPSCWAAPTRSRTLQEGASGPAVSQRESSTPRPGWFGGPALWRPHKTCGLTAPERRPEADGQSGRLRLGWRLASGSAPASMETHRIGRQGAGFNDSLLFITSLPYPLPSDRRSHGYRITQAIGNQRSHLPRGFLGVLRRARLPGRPGLRPQRTPLLASAGWSPWKGPGYSAPVVWMERRRWRYVNDLQFSLTVSGCLGVEE